MGNSIWMSANDVHVSDSGDLMSAFASFAFTMD